MARLCEGGFVGSYLKYTSKQESPVIFHVWTALTVLSAVLRRNVWMDSGGDGTSQTGYYRIYPNIYKVLVSPSGVGRKGTAMKLGVQILDKSGVEIPNIRGKITSTRIVSRLIKTQEKHPQRISTLLIYSEEFKVFTRGIMKDSSLVEDHTAL
jgi:hypothetical protein